MNSFSEEQRLCTNYRQAVFADTNDTGTTALSSRPSPTGVPVRSELGELAAAGLLGIALPEEVGGAGLGFVETGLLRRGHGQEAATSTCGPSRPWRRRRLPWPSSAPRPSAGGGSPA